LLALAALLAIGGGAALGAVAAGRRTDTAFDRFRTAVHDGDVVVNGITDDGLVDLDPALLDEVARVDGVVEAVEFSVMGVSVRDLESYFSPALIASRGESGREVIVEGRTFDLGSHDEVMVNEAMRDEVGLDVGDRIALTSLTKAQWQRYGRGESFGSPAGPEIDVMVVGVFRDVEAISDAPDPLVGLTPAFWTAYRDEIGHCDCFVSVHTEPDARDAVLARVAELYGDGPLVAPAEPYGARVRDTIGLQRSAFWLIAASAAVATIVVVTIASSRFVGARSADDDVWRSLGFAKRRLVLARVVGQAPAAVIGAASALVVGYLLSPLAPVGLARRAEPDPGFRADSTVLGTGSVALVVAACSIFFVTSIRANRGEAARTRRAVRAGSALGPVPRFAIRAVAVSGRGGVVGASLGVAGVIAALTLQGSIDHLLATPALYGADYDAAVIHEIPGELEEMREQLLRDPDIAAVAEGWSSDLDGPLVVGPSGSTTVSAETIAPVQGGIGPVIAAGRPPAGRDEAAVGRATLRQLGASVGDTVTATGANGDVVLRVVGVVVQAGIDESDDGFVLTLEGLERIGRPSLFALYVRLADGVDADDVQRRYAEPGFDVPKPPSEIGNVGQLGQLPLWAGLMLTALGIGALIHASAVTLGRSGRELVIHRALGFTPRQVLGSMAWHGAFTAMAGLVLGVPLGLIAGRFIHHRLVVEVGAVIEAVAPPSVWLVAAAASATCVLLALAAGASVARKNAAAVLRSE
jgi:hypothetical protein